MLSLGGSRTKVREKVANQAAIVNTKPTTAYQKSLLSWISDPAIYRGARNRPERCMSAISNGNAGNCHDSRLPELKSRLELAHVA